MERAAKALGELSLDVDAIVTSPLLRAQQTAAILARRLRCEERLVADPRVGGGFGPRALTEILIEHGEAGAVMLVGHEPAMSRIVADIVGGTVEFKPGTIARIDLPRPTSVHGTLAWRPPAKVLAR